MALSITDLRKGAIFQQDGVPYKVVEYNQKVIGRGGSIVSVKVKSLLDGKVLDKTFKGNEQIEDADVSRQTVSFLYEDKGSYVFMNDETYEQFPLDENEISEQKGYLKEGDKVQMLLFNSRPISIDLPKNVPLKVTYAEQAVKGDTATALMKEATVETGITVKVPAFIKEGDVIRVDTRTGTYLEREKN